MSVENGANESVCTAAFISTIQRSALLISKFSMTRGLPRRRHPGCSHLYLLLLLALPISDAHPQSDAAGSVANFSDCLIGSGAAKLAAQCTTLSVPLNPAEPSQGQIELSVARIPARRQTENTDALTMIAGGPGQSALDTYQSLAGAFRQLTRDRDMILIDQRGTGQSNKLNCPALPETLGHKTTQDLEQIRQQANACLDSLDMDPRFYTTSVAVLDLEEVRHQLGISQWNLYGISYGTRVALHYLRRFPESVRTIALDAVVPPPVSLGPEIATLAQRSLSLIFERCRQNPGCNDAFGHQGESVATLLEDLDRQPQTIRYEDISTGTQTTRTFSRDDLAMTLRLMSYSSQTASILPSMLHQAINYGNFAPLARQSDRQSNLLGETLATGMHHAIVCTEDVPFFPESTSSDVALHDTQRLSNSANSYLGEGIIEMIEATCQSWPQGVIDDDFKEPVRSEVPALILSGEADPITPPDYGTQVAATLSNAHHIVNRAEGHMQVATGCIPILLAKFVDQASVENLDDDCLERIRPLPFFVDANGPLP